MDREVDDHLTIHSIMYGQGGGCRTILPYTLLCMDREVDVGRSYHTLLLCMDREVDVALTILPYTPIMYGQGGGCRTILPLHSYYVWTGRWMTILPYTPIMYGQGGGCAL